MNIAGQYYRHNSGFHNGAKLLHVNRKEETTFLFQDGRRERSEWTPAMVRIMLDSGSLMPVQQYNLDDHPAPKIGVWMNFKCQEL